MRKIYFDFYSFKRIIYRVFFVLLLIFTSHIHYGQNNDLPNPTQHMETIPAGYFIIPMDTNLQNIVPAGQAPFNLKAYGLINSFLQNNIPVRWAIRSGKSLNQADFTALTEQVYPTVGPAAIRSFFAGPFIVPDTVTLCDGTTQSIIEYFGNNVTVYRLKESISIDIRYKITIKPKIAVFINGGNQEIHASILNEAGIPNYVFLDATHIMDIFSCFTFTSEPHWDINTANPVVVNGVKDFALYGGNFLAQCEAIETYENLGYFMTDKGIKSTGNILNNPSHQYHNADLAFMQIHGTLFEKQTGSVPSWTLNTGSTWKNTSYKMVSHKGTDTVRVVGNHLRQPGEIGGNAFFLGSHNYMGNVNKPDLSDLQKVNGLRMYLNAIFIPAIDNNAWANAGSGGSVVCTGNVTLGCLPPGPAGSTFSWSPATGLSCTDCPNPIATPTVTTTYYLTVTGGNGCTAIDSCVVTTGTPLSITLNAPGPICNGGTSSLSINVSSGTAPYTYNWISNPPGFTSTISNPTISPTTNTSYSVTVTDANGCTATGTTTIAVSSITLTGTPLDESCSGSNNGSITTTIDANATLPVSYIWSNGATTSNISGLPSGTYTVTATDGAGCITTQSFQISSNPLITISSTFTPEYCNKANGSIQVSASGGTPPLTYSWDNGITQNASTLTNLISGTYNVTVTDGICPASVTITIPSVAGPTTQISAINATCSLNNGSATILPSGGTPAYTYQWNSGQTTASINSISSGTYTVTVTDAHNCNTINSINITNSSSPIAVIDNIIPETCNLNNGSIAASATSGTQPYSYTWNTNPIQYTNAVTNLSGGTYTVTVTDAIGCISTVSGVIPAFPDLTISGTPQNETCSGLSNGSISVSVSGGSLPIYYTWSNGSTTPTISGLSGGTYTVTATDVNNCTNSHSFTVGTHPPIYATPNSTPEYCNKINGTATVTPLGGSSPFTYSWNTTPPQYTQTASNLPQGFYTVYVTDGFCSTSVNVPVNFINGPTAQTSSTPARCELNNGGAVVNTISGTPPYSYLWNSTPTQTTPNLVNVAAGTYMVTVTDSKGCITSASVTISGSPAPVSAISNPVPANCGYSNGALSVTASSGTLPYTYSWNTNPAQYVTTAQGIPSGTYIVTVTDNYGCTSTAMGVVPMLPGPTAIVTITPELCLQSNGSATVTATGGIGNPYTYMWSNGQTTATATGLSSIPGMYTVVVSDGGCSASNNVSIGNIPGPHAEFIANPKLLTINDGPVFFKDESTGNDIQTWYWTLGDGGNSTVTEFSHLYPHVGVYPVILTITDINGCKDTAVDTIRVRDIFTIYIPNCFTPTEDNINDWFFPAGINWDPDYFEMYIFDRWGNIMYEAFDQKNKYWNGTLNNEGTQDDQFIDVYVYLIRVKEIDGPKHQFIGRVTLLK